MHISNKCSIAVHCLVFLSEYGEREKVTSELLSCSTGCNPVTIRNILSALKKDEIITVKPGTGGAALALPPENDRYPWCSFALLSGGPEHRQCAGQNLRYVEK